VVLSREGREEAARVAYLCGCDGARSIVREGLGVGFGGGTYQHRYYVADVALAEGNRDKDLHLSLKADSFLLRLPARKGEMARLIGFAPDEVEQPTFEDVRSDAEALLGITVAEVNWFSTYKVHHRVADHFRVGRAFLLGDAGHLHSPVGGQGMNTGIGDAVNLAWKLAHVVQGRASPALLDSYEPERIAFARDLVATTDRAFQLIVAEGFAGEAFRRWIVPNVFPIAGRFEAGRHLMFRILSQIRVAYPRSLLSSGSAGRVEGGDRLPWVETLDNFGPLAAADWQVHVYGEPGEAFTWAAAALALPVHAFPFDGAAGEAGLARNAAYLVRPDGYVALAMDRPDGDALAAYLRERSITMATEPLDLAPVAEPGP
jgi:FAD binding domain